MTLPLFLQAPSARLADYAKYGQRVLTTGAPEAEQLQRGFAALQGCVEEACSLAAEMDRLVVASSEAWQSSAYGNQSSSCDNLDSATISALQVGEGGEQREADGDGGPGSGRLPRGLGGGGGGGGGSAEEQCLVATGLLHAVRLELQLMVSHAATWDGVRLSVCALSGGEGASYRQLACVSCSSCLSFASAQCVLAF